MDSNTFASLDEIKYAATILIGDESFDEQKTAIIESNESRDIKACPGSGKTTALLAKLIVLAKRMPLENNQGICVLTHTNVAIDEIKNKLGHKSDILFKYPNHFGTIQSFVDKYLAVPNFIKIFGCKPKYIDNDFSNRCILKRFKFNIKDFDSETHKNARYYLNTNRNLTSLRFDFNELNKIFLTEGINGKVLQIKRPRKDTWSEIEKENVIKWICKLKKNVFAIDNCICFDDAYFLAKLYLGKFPIKVKTALSKRFKYVFIDEMQDSDKHQIDIIEKAFNREITVMQRFGDPNQSIFNKVRVDNIWSLVNPLPIDSSKRFGEKIAHVLKTVCIENNQDLNHNDVIQSFDPVIISFDNPESVLPKFCELLVKPDCDGETVWNLAEKEEIATKKSKKIKAIGWVGEPNSPDRQPNRYTIQSYFKNFKKNIKKKEKVNYDSIKSFLNKQDNARVKDYADKIIEALLHILHLDEKKIIKKGIKRNYTKTSLLQELKENHENEFKIFMVNIAKWSKVINSTELVNEDVYNEIKSFINNEFHEIYSFNKTNSDIVNFLNSEATFDNFTEDEMKANNTYVCDYNSEIKVQLGTIHSVKGETHAATLYLETCYQGKHESELIMEQLKGRSYIAPQNGDVYKKETLKMAYVGMSRPRYLLCMAIHKDRIAGHETELEDNGWKIERTYGN